MWRHSRAALRRSRRVRGGHFDVWRPPSTFCASFFPMPRSGSAGMQRGRFRQRRDKRGQGQGAGPMGCLMLMTECGPSILPSLSSKQQGLGKRGLGGGIETSISGSNPLPAQRKALSLSAVLTLGTILAGHHLLILHTDDCPSVPETPRPCL